MSKHNINLPLIYALNERNELVYVKSVPRGLACNCHCNCCGEKLLAKHGNMDINGDGKIPHFAHVSNKSCEGAYMSHLHLRAQQIIEEKQAVMAPEYRKNNSILDARKLLFVYTNTEERDEWKGIRPDVFGQTGDGKKWAIEIYYTNKVNRDKESKIKELGVSCLEIDINNQTFDSLENFLLNSTAGRYWINNPNDDELLPNNDPSANTLIDEEIIGMDYCPIQETPVPDYINRPSIINSLLNPNIKLKIPKSCQSLYEYYIYLKQRKTFLYGGRIHKIFKIEYSSDCEQIAIFYQGNYGFSYCYLTVVYCDLYGNIHESTQNIDYIHMDIMMEAIRNDWELKRNENATLEKR